MEDTVTVGSMDSGRGAGKMSIHEWSMDAHSNCGIHGYIDRGGDRQGAHPWNVHGNTQ